MLPKPKLPETKETVLVECHEGGYLSVALANKTSQYVLVIDVRKCFVKKIEHNLWCFV